MTEPYLQTEHATLYLADAREILPQFETESFGLVVTDPPYGVDFQSSMRAEKFDAIANDGTNDRGVIEDILTHCVRLVGQNRHLYVFGPEVLRDAMNAKVSAPAQIIWDKGTISMGDLSSPWGPQHELIYFYTSLHRHGGKRGSENNPVRLRKGSVLTHSRRTGRTLRHPTEKPVPLLSELIESSSRIGDTILDPFAGVGSTGVAATLLGRKSVLVELDEKFAEIAATRLVAAECVREQAVAA